MDEIWKEKAQELSKVVKKLGRFPQADEKMGSFLLAQRQISKGNRSGMWTRDRENYLNSNLPGWDLNYQDYKWKEEVQKLFKVRQQLGRFPEQNEEMGFFLFIQQKTYSKKTDNRWAEREAYLDEHLPGWKG